MRDIEAVIDTKRSLDLTVSSFLEDSDSTIRVNGGEIERL